MQSKGRRWVERTVQTHAVLSHLHVFVYLYICKKNTHTFLEFKKNISNAHIHTFKRFFVVLSWLIRDLGRRPWKLTSCVHINTNDPHLFHTVAPLKMFLHLLFGMIKSHARMLPVVLPANTQYLIQDSSHV